MIKSSFQGLSIAIETVRIVEELMEIWLNEVCDKYNLVNNLGFNLCVAPWSPVVRLVMYFGVEGSYQKRGPKEID